MHNQLGNRPPQSKFLWHKYVHIEIRLYNLLTQLIIFLRTPSESSPFTHYVNCFQQYTPKLTLCVDYYYSMVCNLFAGISTFMWIIVLCMLFNLVWVYSTKYVRIYNALNL